MGSDLAERPAGVDARGAPAAVLAVPRAHSCHAYRQRSGSSADHWIIFSNFKPSFSSSLMELWLSGVTMARTRRSPRVFRASPITAEAASYAYPAPQNL